MSFKLGKRCIIMQMYSMMICDAIKIDQLGSAVDNSITFSNNEFCFFMWHIIRWKHLSVMLTAIQQILTLISNKNVARSDPIQIHWHFSWLISKKSFDWFSCRFWNRRKLTKKIIEKLSFVVSHALDYIVSCFSRLIFQLIYRSFNGEFIGCWGHKLCNSIVLFANRVYDFDEMKIHNSKSRGV